MKKRQNQLQDVPHGLYEIWETDRYLYSAFPSDGNPIHVLEEEQRRHPRAFLVQVLDGERIVVQGPTEQRRTDEPEEWYGFEIEEDYQ